MSQKKIINILLLELWAIVLSTVTGVLGPIPLLILRRRFSRRVFVVLGAALSVALAMVNATLIWLPFTVSWILIFIYFEFETKGLLKAGLISVLITACAGSLMLFAWGRVHSVDVLNELRTGIETQTKLLSPQIQIDSNKVYTQIPSMFLSVLTIALWLSILFERRFNRGSDRVNLELLTFKIPENAVWALIISALCAFVNFKVEGLQVAAANALNLLMLLYFFQGLSIIAFVFKIFKTGPLLKAIFYAMFITQLFLFVAIFGIIDYWLNFRERISKKVMSDKSE